jgi:hypothetical protein
MLCANTSQCPLWFFDNACSRFIHRGNCLVVRSIIHSTLHKQWMLNGCSALVHCTDNAKWVLNPVNGRGGANNMLHSPLSWAARELQRVTYQSWARWIRWTKAVGHRSGNGMALAPHCAPAPNRAEGGRRRPSKEEGGRRRLVNGIENRETEIR